MVWVLLLWSEETSLGSRWGCWWDVRKCFCSSPAYWGLDRPWWRDKAMEPFFLSVLCTSARPPPLFRWSALFHGLIVLQKMTLFDWLKRHRGDKYSTKETCLTTFIQDMHAVGFHDDAGCCCSDFGLFTLFFAKLDASEIRKCSKEHQSERSSWVQSPLSLADLLSGCSGGRSTRVPHTSFPWTYEPSSEVYRRNPPLGNHPGPSKPHDRYLSHHFFNALITRCRTLTSESVVTCWTG